MLFQLLLALLCVCVHAETVRYVFKGPGAAVSSARMKQMTFGLNSSQVEKIRELSGLDFGNVFYLDAETSSVLATRPGFSGVIYPNVPPPQEVSVTAADPELASLWWINQLNVVPAWALASGKGVTIADCDAGIYYDEKDLHANVLTDLAWDFSDPVNPSVVTDGPYAYHGTAVAAIMLGVMDGLGTNGIAYNAKLVPFQNYNYDESDKLDKEEATAQCILKAITTPGVQIIVLENQTADGSSETFVGTRDAVRLALKSGITIVSAAGNSNVELLEEAKDNTESIIVGAITAANAPESFTNYGDRITVGAYGDNLRTLYGPNGEFGDFGGTSGATPQVAATVALMKEVSPLLTPAQAKSALMWSRDVDDSNRRAGGKLDVYKAVVAAQSAVVDFQAWNDQWFFRQQLVAILQKP